jgi:predicted ester cyclase
MIGEQMNAADLKSRYEAYLDCLNARDWDRLGEVVHDDAVHNGRPLGLAGYRRMLENDVEMIPDLQFHSELVVCEPPFISARLRFDCTPKGEFLGLPVNGRKLCFHENIIYRLEGGKVREAWSVIDKASIEDQLA